LQQPDTAAGLMAVIDLSVMRSFISFFEVNDVETKLLVLVVHRGDCFRTFRTINSGGYG
jgi:hypothetical protein